MNLTFQENFLNSKKRRDFIKIDCNQIIPISISDCCFKLSLLDSEQKEIGGYIYQKFPEGLHQLLVLEVYDEIDKSSRLLISNNDDFLEILESRIFLIKQNIKIVENIVLKK